VRLGGRLLKVLIARSEAVSTFSLAGTYKSYLLTLTSQSRDRKHEPTGYTGRALEKEKKIGSKSVLQRQICEYLILSCGLPKSEKAAASISGSGILSPRRTA
jgi:hypothetical protein